MIVDLIYDNGVFIPVRPLTEIEDGTRVTFRWPDDVYLCEADRLAALDQGRVIVRDPSDAAAYQTNDDD